MSIIHRSAVLHNASNETHLLRIVKTYYQIRIALMLVVRNPQSPMYNSWRVFMEIYVTVLRWQYSDSLGSRCFERRIKESLKCMQRRILYVQVAREWGGDLRPGCHIAPWYIANSVTGSSELYSFPKRLSPSTRIRQRLEMTPLEMARNSGALKLTCTDRARREGKQQNIDPHSGVLGE